MTITEATARKAVERWALEGRHAVVAACGCRFWQMDIFDITDPDPQRRIYTCPQHRPSYVPGSALADA